MKYIKKREQFLENKSIIKDDALDILANNDEGQDPVLQNNLEKLDSVSTDRQVVVRLGPSPTGFFHLGSSRTALYNYLFAKKHKGRFIVRLEDTDQKRFVPEAEDYIKRSLEWLGIEADEDPWKGGPNGPYRQSERDYTQHTKTLIDSGNAYYAFDTEEDVQKARNANLTPDGKNSMFAYDSKTRMSMKNSLSLSKDEVDKLLAEKTPYVIRFKVPGNETLTYTDIIRGEITYNTNQADDKVLIKSTGMVSYHMANVCDDHDMGVTHVLRGEEWSASTPLHILLYRAFGWEPPQFAHLPNILKPDGKGKLSKRDGLKLGIPIFPFGGEGTDDKGNVVKYKGFKDEGFEPDALLNFLALLGWSSPDSKELLSMAEMISNFDLSRVHKAGARFDMDKAKWFNHSYINLNRSDKELLNHIDVGTTYQYDNNKLSQIITLCKQRSHFVKEMQPIADIFFKPVILTDKDKATIKDDFKIVFNEFINRIDKWDIETIKQLIYDICTEKGIKMGKVMPGLRMALAGGLPGPDLMSLFDIIGKEESINRIKNAL